MSDSPKCPKCGSELSPGVAQGLCPRCLLQAGIDQAAADLSAPNLVPAAVTPAETPTQPVSARVDEARGPQPAGTRVHYFGDYELLDEIARGGMGIVYKARQVSLNRIVALKMILSGQFASETEVERFHAEAQAAASLQHPHIVAIHEVGQHEGQHYFSMDYVAGQSLAQIVRDQPLSPTKAAEYLQKIAEAIDYAHRQGTLHRDLKPSNVLIDQFDQPRVTDFGLAKRIEGSAQLTATGSLVGTPSYMPPEQAGTESGKIGPASDVYSLGAVLYELLTGRPPFVGETLAATLNQVLNAEPMSPRVVNPKLHRDLETICLKCLEKQTRNRYLTAGALAEDLGRFLQHEPIVARPIGRINRAWRWCQRKPTVVGLAAAVVMIGCISWYFLLTQSRHTELNRYFSQIAQADREWEANNVAQADKLLDQCAAELRDWEWHYLKRACHPERLLLTSSEAIFEPLPAEYEARYRRQAQPHTLPRIVWDNDLQEPRIEKPEGNSGAIAIRLPGVQRDNHEFSGDGRRVMLYGVHQDHTQRFAESLAHVDVYDLNTAKRIFNARWEGREFTIALNHDGSRLAIFGWIPTPQGRISQDLVDVETGERVVTLDPGYGSAVVEFTSDDKHLIAIDHLHPGIVVIEADTGHVTRRMDQPAKIALARVSPDRQLVATASADFTIRIWRWSTGELLQLFEGHTQNVRALAWSQDGSRLASAGQDDKVLVWDIQKGRQLGRVKGNTVETWSVSFVGDANDVITTTHQGNPDHRSVWSLADVPGVITCRGHTAKVLAVSFTPSGRQIASAGGNYRGLAVGLPGEVKLWDVATGTEVRSYLGHTHPATSVAVSPDGRYLASGATNGALRVWHIDSGELVHSDRASDPSDGRFVQLSFSPDGTLLAKLTGDSYGLSGVELCDAATWKKLPDLEPAKRRILSPAGIAFTPDGQRLIVMDGVGAFCWDLAVGGKLSVREAFQVIKGIMLPAGYYYGPLLAMSRDGRLFATALQDTPRTCHVGIWDARSWGYVVGTAEQLGYVAASAFSADGSRLASGSFDKSIKIWDLESGSETLTLRGHEDAVVSIAFSPDGWRLASGSWDGTLKIWDATPKTAPAK